MERRSTDRCVVCGSEGPGLETEPRFLYTVCPEHARLSPVTVSRIANDPKHREEYLDRDPS